MASDGFGLFNLLPKKQEARLCLRCTEGLVEMLRQEPGLLADVHRAGRRRCGSVDVHLL